MNLRKPLLLLIVLLALGAYVYFVELPREKEEAEKKKLFSLDKDAVTEVTLTYPDHAITLKKDTAGKWQITQPVTTEADDTTVSNLISALADAEVTRTLDDVQQDLNLYGLTSPLVKVKLTLKDGKTLPEVSIGKDTPVGFSVYVQKAGDSKLVLVPQAVRLGMTKEVKDLRDKAILSFNDDEVKKIEIRSSEKDIVLNKTDAGWSLEKPTTAKADDNEVRTFLSNLRSMRAQDFIEQPLLELKEFGLAPPLLSISLALGADNAQKTILIGGEKSDDKGGKNRYVKRGEKETLFLVGDWVYRDLNKSASEFRDKTVMRFTEDQAVRIEVKRQDGEGFILTRGADKKWSIDKTQEGTLKEAALGQFVTDLHELRGFEIAAENPSNLNLYGLDDPTVTITVSDGSGAKLASLLAGQKAEGESKKSFAMAEGGQTVFTLRDYVFDRVNKNPADFWEKPAEKKETPPAPSLESSTEEKEGGSEEEEVGD